MPKHKTARKVLIIDFDSTFVKIEALDNLFAISLQNDREKEKTVREIEKITTLGMEGVISFPQSLEKRFSLLKASKVHIEKLVELLQKNISGSIIENKKFFIKNSKDIYIISGGFIDYIYPVVSVYGVKRNHILANKFIFDKNGFIVGFDAKNPLAKENGKTTAVSSLGLKNCETIMIGDGYTDYEVRKNKKADLFVLFCENIKRKKIICLADKVAYSFNEIIQT